MRQQRIKETRLVALRRDIDRWIDLCNKEAMEDHIHSASGGASLFAKKVDLKRRAQKIILGAVVHEL